MDVLRLLKKELETKKNFVYYFTKNFSNFRICLGKIEIASKK